MSDADYYGAPRPYAFDPLADPEYFQGVLGRRILACLIDAVLICAPIVLAAVFIFVFGFITLGLGWFLYGLLSPAFVIWALVYAGLTLGGPFSATIGMRAMGIEMRLWHGAPMSPLLAVLSLVLFWVSLSVLTPFVLLVGLFNARRRLLHDIILGTVVTNSEERAAQLRPRWR
ncbi:putative RDD family membrane protein YckC [Angulomicrobium tetraedrale]|uniref:Putative RDD family membrane protein YckC n=1 Tax=Ancylobacter tetraedralis TaxID=217068 RepID=A0A839ZDT7_9HYPH|nr:RDD family protein [Ancylobacter tetraedralis]MBB3772961.1 putative RDD family membrane protein YckC [Ancylobacter tetraedralis]